VWETKNPDKSGLLVKVEKKLFLLLSLSHFVYVGLTAFLALWLATAQPRQITLILEQT